MSPFFNVFKRVHWQPQQFQTWSCVAEVENIQRLVQNRTTVWRTDWKMVAKATPECCFQSSYRPIFWQELNYFVVIGGSCTCAMCSCLAAHLDGDRVCWVLPTHWERKPRECCIVGNKAITPVWSLNICLKCIYMTSCGINAMGSMGRDITIYGRGLSRAW